MRCGAVCSEPEARRDPTSEAPDHQPSPLIGSGGSRPIAVETLAVSLGGTRNARRRNFVLASQPAAQELRAIVPALACAADRAGHTNVPVDHVGLVDVLHRHAGLLERIRIRRAL